MDHAASVTADSNLRRLDLNLLVVLDALLRERNVSRAARDLQVSQPVASAALAKIRRFFDDPILVRQGRSYELSALAQQLRPAVAEALQAVRRVTDARKSFDAGEEFEVSIVCSEVLAILLVPEIGRRMRLEAPRSRLRVREPAELGDVSVDSMLAGYVDGLIRPHGAPSGLEHIDLLVDEWVLAVAADDPAESLTLADLETRPWLVARLPSGDLAPGMRTLLSTGIRPRIDVDVAGSMAMPFFLQGTDRVAVIGRRLITDLGETMGIREIPGPVSLGGLRQALWWHPSRRDDPVHRWFRSITREAASRLSPELVPPAQL